VSTLRRIGHKGADHIAPGNTLASFDAALEHGCDMVEFDVLPERDPDGRRTGRLVLAHDYEDAGKREPITLEEGLAHFASDAYADVELDVDLKLAGYEEHVIGALREHRLDDRSIVSTMESESLVTIRRLAPELRLGWSVPKVRRDYLASPFTRPVALAFLQYLRRVMPGRAAKEIRDGRIDALMSHWSVVTPRLAAAVAGAGGELYVWTVDDARRIAAFERMGVTGVITNDPRLFS
jgi:glycerophosphoryl diester phosphodiesterase